MNPSLMDLKFIGLMLVLALIRARLPHRWYPAFGALASAALVGLASPATLIAVVAISLGYLYPLHLLSAWARKRTGNATRSKTWLVLGVAGLVALMVLFKAQQAFTVPLLSGSLLGHELLALIGFSYFLFRAINFLYVQHLLDLDVRTPWALLFFVLFPPTLTSGPIQRYPDFQDQLNKPQPLSADNLSTAVYRITRGYFRKICLAYVFNEVLQSLLAAETPMAYTSLAVIATQYLYFYFDFAGYSDIAIGFGLLLGIKVPENFKQPFLATSISEFWRNWHITLLAWFRDHVFFPLGGARNRKKAGLLALGIMLLCGLWHGFTPMFVIWGLFHGVMLMIEHITGAKPIPPARRHGVWYWSKVCWTNARVAFSMLFFLPDSASLLTVFEGLTRWW